MSNEDSLEDKGGTAFPATMLGHSWTGMTLRDYFAGQVLQGMAYWRELKYIDQQEEVAMTCYSMADAMLKERLE